MKKNHDPPPMEDRDDVARLLRLAGKRRAVPRERATRVRAAARAHWKQEVRRRSRKRTLWTAAALAAAACLVPAAALWLLPSATNAPAGAEAAVRIEALAGTAWNRLAAGGPRRTLGVGHDVPLGSELLTGGESRAAVRLPSGHSVRLDTSTKVRLLEDGSLALDRGGVYVDSGAATAAAGALEVRTPLGVVRETGTQYEVRVEEAGVRVRLREGAAVLSLDEQAHQVRAGTELEVHRDGSVSRGPIPTHGSEWGWIVEITPMPDLEGRTARAFLEWVARERGWKLAFADETVARAAGETVLGGTVRRLTLEEVLDAVLPACRMTYRVEEGVLLVAAESQGPGA